MICDVTVLLFACTVTMLEIPTYFRERYRDLIDAADTIGSMSSSSASIFQSLGSLRRKMSTIPTQLSAIPKTRSTTDGISCR